MAVLAANLDLALRTRHPFGIQVDVVRKLQRAGTVQRCWGLHPRANEFFRIVRVVELNSKLRMVFHKVANILDLSFRRIRANVLVTLRTTALGEHFVLLCQTKLAPVISMAGGTSQAIRAGRGIVGVCGRVFRAGHMRTDSFVARLAVLVLNALKRCCVTCAAIVRPCVMLLIQRPWIPKTVQRFPSRNGCSHFSTGQAGICRSAYCGVGRRR